MNSTKPKITPALPRGMRDLLPDQLAVRYKVIETLRRVFELYGFQPLETPAMERLEILSGKGGEESDKLSFLVMKRGEELQRALEKVKAGEAPVTELADMGLRYDLTVPLARVAAMYQGKLPMPFKRYQIAPVWRAERPQHGRYREFTQCDVDIVGTDSPVADIEIISLMLDGYEAILREFGLSNLEIVVKVNHRGLLWQFSEMLGNTTEQFKSFCIALDKLDKIGRDGVEREMAERGLSVSRLQEYWSLVDKGNEEQSWNEIFDYLKTELKESFDSSPFENLREIMWHADIWRRKINRDFSLARGLDYYTGMILEVEVLGKKIGSLGGGGRYDGLISAFSKQSLPAVGASFGLERIVDIILDEREEWSPQIGPDIILIETETGIEPGQLGKVVITSLRENGISCERSYSRDEKHLKLASRRNAKFVVIVDSKSRREFNMNTMSSRGSAGSTQSYFKESLLSFTKEKNSVPDSITIDIKRLSDGEQRRLTLPQIVEWINESK